ncbi:hypothetical protein V2J09_013738 [Rumex salicifolius]
MAFSSGRRSFTTFVSRVLSHKPSPSFSSSRSRFALAAVAQQPQYRPPMLFPNSVNLPTRSMATEGHSPLNDPSPNWNNRPPKETILLEGCDFEHWLVVLEFPDPKPSNEEMVSAYVKALAQVVGSEEEARSKIYSVCTTTYTGFGCQISEELSYKMKEIPNVLWVLPDSYLDVPNKDYGGDLFVDGKVIRRPQYDFTNRQQSKPRNRPTPDRRRESMQGERRAPRQLQNSNQTKQETTSVEPKPVRAGNNLKETEPDRAANTSVAEVDGSTRI